MKTYKLKGLEYYATDCRSIFHALITFLINKCGVTEDNIEEYYGVIPENADKVFYGV